MKKNFKFIEIWGGLPDPKFGIPVPILITGENGTGKELVARAIHQVSELDNKVEREKFVPDNIAGWTETMFEDTIYGHVKNAFTDGKNDHKDRTSHSKLSLCKITSLLLG